VNRTGASPEGTTGRRRGEIEFFVVDLDAWAAAWPDDSDVAAIDRSEANRLRRPEQARRLLARRSVVRSLLAERLGTEPAGLVVSRLCPTCGATDHGKPFVSGAPVSFSVASSGGVAAFALSESAVGVDLEVEDPKLTPQRRAMAERELRGLAALPVGRRGTGFLRLWTAKEAVLKAAGRTLADDPSTVDVAELLWSRSAVVALGHRRWHVRHLAIDDRSEGTVLLAVADDLRRPVSMRSAWSVGGARVSSTTFPGVPST
jgi:phosphopantetheinyl transferase